MKRLAPIALTLLLCFLPTTIMAQGLGGDLFQGIEGFDDFGGGNQSEPNLKITASYVIDPAATHGRVDITATVGSGWCVYSTTQPKGGPMQTKLKVESNPAITAVGEFTPDHKPKIVPPDKIIRVAQEKFYEKVTWSAPFLLAPGTKAEDLKLKVKLSGQSCHDKGTCVPVSAEAVAKFDGEQEVPKPENLLPEKATTPGGAIPPADYKIQGTMGDYTTEGNHGVLSGKFVPSRVEPGDKITVTLNFKPKGNYHIYAYSPTDSTIGYKSTQIALAETTPWLATQAATENPVIEKALIEGFPAVRYHDGETTWKFTVQVPIDAVPGKYPLVGYVGYQTCTDTTCDRPSGAMFEGVVQVGEKGKDESAPLAFSAAKYNQAAERAKVTHAEVQDAMGDNAGPVIGLPKQEQPPENNVMAPPVPLNNNIQWTVLNPPETASLAWIIVLSFIGGAILNLMPCVLPVVGLKILSFVNQAGKHRGQVFMLNLIYSLGVIFVFMLLAVVSSSLNLIVGYFNPGDGTAGGADGLAWGQWSGDWRYILAMIILVYTMGLSMLGVWELTMPSFMGSGSVANASNKTGYGGAFFKGIVTTLLSTPCSGPFLGPVFGYTISQPTIVTFVVFGSIGLGMASPYLIIGMNPRLIAFLPKPGNWMVAFKQLMGFVMMLTVVYLMYTMPDEYVVPTLTLLVGLAAGCWMLGQVHMLEHKSSKIATTVGAFVVAIGIGYFAYNNLIEGDAHDGSIAWNTYAEERWPALENDIYARQQAGETVMVDFTADWCPTCKVNYYTAINTDGVGEVVNQHGIVPMLVDWTNTTHDNSPQVQKFINKLGSNSIPLLAIFPGGKAGEVFVLSDLLTESKVIESLNAAQQESGNVPKQTAMQE
ncbi:protein-disulfide reductase DsbD family protein [Bremerella alba]|uniref:Thiol:disulfide interchange protein DsbD n=1 Tax=Bremerella alba TaxID=980252 RepID=A0A7V8V3D1_9BACT|nr:thioredoxin family protein [Bremerella alba]MBA2114026.1 Thiol:disulfide interchange protein DsbD [Bremerella alba]